LSFSWVDPRLEVRKTKRRGKGLFATKRIGKDELLVIFGGYVFPLEEIGSLAEELQDECIQISDRFCLGIKKPSELEDASYINHSCDPNAGFKGQIFLVAMKPIAENEEITFDYAMELDDISSGLYPYRMVCNCGSKLCRGVITDQDWKLPELQERYRGYFQWWLQEKIEKERDSSSS